MKNRFFSVLLFCLILPLVNLSESLAEMLPIDNGLSFSVQAIDRPHDRNHEQSQWRYKLPASVLERAGTKRTQAAEPGFQVPLRRGISNNNPGVFNIAAFVDHDAGPDSLLDWNCGDRTYDTPEFNHNGTDYNGSPYPWLDMANDGLVVVAAADGEIVDIHDGEPDQQCSPVPGADANYVVLLHDDGTITIYAHLKTGSVTPRKVGEMVEQGDYLGVVGSSGQSNGPHLHLGVQDLANNILDPYAGACNASNSESFWAEQEPYARKMIMDVATHDAVPESPPCPQQEVPHYHDVFGPDDVIVYSLTVRDFEGGDVIGIEIRDPADEVVFSTAFSNPGFGFAARLTVLGNVQSQDSEEGKYSLRATYNGETRVHYFYIGGGPPPAPGAKPANNAYTGLWYDPTLDGEGFNIVAAGSGTIVYFYGSDNRGNRIWLISDLIQGEIVDGSPIEVLMFESSGGIFSSPVRSTRGLAAWGTLILTFIDCRNGQSTLNGIDGFKVSRITKLAGVSGASCVDGEVSADSAWAGLWYDPSKDGEGYNLIVAPGGRILYFYGFKTNGLRLWLISGLIEEALETGSTVEVTMYESNQGTFAAPVASEDALIVWGSAKITVIDCKTITIVIEGLDGTKTSNTVRLAGIIGLSCSD